MKTHAGRWGVSFMDTLLILGGLAVVASLAHPPLARRAREHRVARVISGVEALRTAATEYRQRQGRWPEQDHVGQMPPDLATLLPDDLTLRSADYALSWTAWKVVEVPPQPAPPTVSADAPPPTEWPTAPPAPADAMGTRPQVVRRLGVITVRSSEEDLLGTLLDRYGPARSFVRDSTWMLIVGTDSAS